MKLSILPVSLFSEITSGKITLAEWAEYAQNFGADGYDASILFFPNSTPTTVMNMKQQLADKNITIQPTMVCTYPDFTNPSKFERERQVDYFKRDLGLIADFGFKYVRMTAGMAHEGLSIADGVKNCRECVEQVIGTAEKYGLKLCVENHSKPGAWPLVDFTFNPDAFLATYEMIKDLPVGINFDTANAIACGANLHDMLSTVIDKVWTIHMNDSATVGFWTPIGIGKGLVDFDDVFDILKKNSFDGWVCIEEASGCGVQGAKDAIDFARKYVY
ncbi:MAG: sugar phosphate isomerase/epimerase [Clostridia bacterium]|nr:sugar phosphate isomerase/epimerase [Clostridia bacterium]